MDAALKKALSTYRLVRSCEVLAGECGHVMVSTFDTTRSSSA